jgi:cell division ATPase FtsA
LRNRLVPVQLTYETPEPVLSKKKGPTAYSLVDVGRDTVKAIVVLIIPGQPEPQVVGYGKAETDHRDVTGGRLEADAVTRPVNIALTEAEDSTESVIGHKIVPDDVVFALAGRATLGKLFTVKQSRPKSGTPISARELRNLRSRAEKLVRRDLAETPIEGGQWQPLAVNDAGLRLDNHLVLEGLGLTGQDISFSVFGVAGLTSALRSLEVLASRLDLAIANIVASPQALASITPYAEAIILDVGFSGTDVCLVRDDALVAAEWIPFGGNFFTQSLARAMNLEVEAANELKHAFARGEAARADMALVEANLDGPRKRWYDAIMEVMARLSPDEPLPRRLYMTGGSSLLPGLDKLLRIDPAPFDSAPEVMPLSHHSALMVKDLTNSLDYHLFTLALSLIIGLPE